MAQEIDYIDINLHSESIEDNILSEKLELFFQELELSLTVAPNEIWGVKDAVNLSRYLFNRYVSITQIKNEISNFISNNCQHAKDFQYVISIQNLKNANSKYTVFGEKPTSIAGTSRGVIDKKLSQAIMIQVDAEVFYAKILRINH